MLIAAAFWGLSGVFAQFLFQSRGFEPDWLVCIRLFIPGMILLAISATQKGLSSIFTVWRHDAFKLFIYSVFGMMAVQLTFFLTIKHSNAATATVLQFVNPVFIAIALSVMLKKLPSKRMLIAITIALLGTFFVATHGRIGTLTITRPALFWGITSAVASAFYTLYSVKLIRDWGGTLIVGWAMLVGGIVLGLTVNPFEISGQWDILSFLSVGYILFFGSLLTFYLFLMGVQYIGGAKASVLSCAEPLAAAVFSVILLNTSFTGMDWLGTFCITTAVLILARVK